MLTVAIISVGDQLGVNGMNGASRLSPDANWQAKSQKVSVWPKQTRIQIDYQYSMLFRAPPDEVYGGPIVITSSVHPSVCLS